MEQTETFLLQQARNGEQSAFTHLIQPYRQRLFAHCYRMLGSSHDAEDAVQETLLRAWRKLTTFQKSGSFKSWLYKIATNICLDLLRKRPKRTIIQPDISALEQLPSDLTPMQEYLWIEPASDTLLPDSESDPEAVYSLRESVSLAFITVLQKLPPKQRAVLILRDVLNWRAEEVAEHLELTVSSVNSALHRARQTLQTENYTDKHRSRPNDSEVNQLLKRYISAWESANITELVALVKEDAILTMPPLPLWFKGRDTIRQFWQHMIFADGSTDGWRVKQTQANLQPALALYRRNELTGIYEIFCVLSVTFEGKTIIQLDHFITDHMLINGDLKSSWFGYFGLPKELTVN